MNGEEKIKPVAIEEIKAITEAVRQAKEYTDKKYKQINLLMIGVVVVCFLGFLQLIIDSFHINSVTYTEYSQRVEERNEMLKLNKSLLEENKVLLQELTDIKNNPQGGCGN